MTITYLEAFPRIQNNILNWLFFMNVFYQALYFLSWNYYEGMIKYLLKKSTKLNPTINNYFIVKRLVEYT